MTHSEMIEILKKGARVTDAEAEAALEASNWDLLDAMLLLEKQGKVGPGGGSYSTRADEEESAEDGAGRGHEGGRGLLRRLGALCLRLLRVGNANAFVVSRQGRELFALPVTALVLLLLLGNCFFALALIVAGLFFGLRYSFRGPNLGKPSVNAAMDRAARAAETVKDELRGHTGGEA